SDGDRPQGMAEYLGYQNNDPGTDPGDSSSIRATAASTRSSICKATRAFCRPTPMPVSTGFTTPQAQLRNEMRTAPSATRRASGSKIQRVYERFLSLPRYPRGPFRQMWRFENIAAN